MNTVMRDSPALLTIINKAIVAIFRDPASIYMTVKVKDILFEGTMINCSVKEFSAKAVCTQMKGQIPGLKEPEKNIYLFSLLGSVSIRHTSRKIQSLLSDYRLVD